MPVISFANPKGGSGKTTTALIVASTLLEAGENVALVDGDPQKWISLWSEGAAPDGLHLFGDVREDNIIDLIEEAQAVCRFVLVDLEGTASLTVASAVGMSDLVLVPLQGSGMDAQGAVKMLGLIARQEKLVRRAIKRRVVLTRVGAAVKTRALRNIMHELREAEVPLLDTQVVERAAFRDMFDYESVLGKLDRSKVSNLDKAVRNADDLTGEIVAVLRGQRE